MQKGREISHQCLPSCITSPAELKKRGNMGNKFPEPMSDFKLQGLFMLGLSEMRALLVLQEERRSTIYLSFFLSPPDTLLPVS